MRKTKIVNTKTGRAKYVDLSEPRNPLFELFDFFVLMPIWVVREHYRKWKDPNYTSNLF